jgi:hypothetical protein
MIARTVTLFLTLTCVATLGHPASAQEFSLGQAELLFQRGRESMKNGQLPEALKNFADSYELDAKPGTLLNMSLCEEKLGHLMKARAHLRQFLDWAPSDDDRRQLALRHLNDIDPRIPHVTIRLGERMAPTTAVRIDGTAMGDLDSKTPLPIDPGEHTLAVMAADGTERKTTFHIKERQDLLQMVDWGDATDGRLPLPVSSTPPPPTTTVARERAVEPTESAGRQLSLPGVILGTVGAAAAVGTAFCALEVLWNKRVVEQHCVGGCDAEALDAASAGKKWSIAGTAMGATAVVGLGAGAYFLFFRAPKASGTPVPSSTAKLRIHVRATGPIFALSGTF